MADFPWTPAAVEMLRCLVEDRQSSGYAAEALRRKFGGYLSRNAVVGKATRLGLHFQSVQNTRQIRRASKPVSLAATEPAQKPAAPPEPARLEPTRLPTIAMTNPIAPRVSPEKALASPAPVVAPIADIEIPESKQVTLFDLRETMCRWPMGDPRAADFRFCGARAPGQGPYCGYHAQIAYEPAQDRRRSRDQAKRARAA